MPCFLAATGISPAPAVKARISSFQPDEKSKCKRGFLLPKTFAAEKMSA
jgi:hypothetical protein